MDRHFAYTALLALKTVLLALGVRPGSFEQKVVLVAESLNDGMRGCYWTATMFFVHQSVGKNTKHL